MQAIVNPNPLMLGRRASTLRGRWSRPRRALGSTLGPRKRCSDWLRSLPRPWHLVPYGALVVLGIALLSPGVVPSVPTCVVLDGTPAGERELFIHLSAAAFGLVAGLLLLSALAASAQRRGGRPGAPTVVGASLFGAVTLAAVASPHAPIAAPVQAVMVIDVLGIVMSCGVGLLIPILASVLAWHKLCGARSLRVAQIAAWTTLLIALPLVMAATYLAVTPFCFN